MSAGSYYRLTPPPLCCLLFGTVTILNDHCTTETYWWGDYGFRLLFSLSHLQLIRSMPFAVAEEWPSHQNTANESTSINNTQSTWSSAVKVSTTQTKSPRMKVKSRAKLVDWAQFNHLPYAWMVATWIYYSYEYERTSHLSSWPNDGLHMSNNLSVGSLLSRASNGDLGRNIYHCQRPPLLQKEDCWARNSRSIFATSYIALSKCIHSWTLAK